MKSVKALTLISLVLTCILSSVHVDAQAQAALALIGEELGGELLDGAKQLIGTLTSYLSDNLLGNHPFQVVLGRGVRITQNGNSVSIQDVSSGLTAAGHGATPEDALADATTRFVAMLLKIGIISKDDLHLAPAPRTTTAIPCGNNFPEHYCGRYKSMCANSALSSFLKTNCFKTCACSVMRVQTSIGLPVIQQNWYMVNVTKCRSSHCFANSFD